MIQHDITNITSDVDTSAFSIEMNSSMFTMLTKNVYNDVMLAPIREWSCNAIDACIEAGNTPTYDVHVPTISEPTFSVRDYGTGLAEDDITGLFSVLGASTKRHSNKYNGTFGIGRMSGLAYATSFTVTSYFNSTEYTYLISIKEGIPANIKLSEHPTSEPNGLKISLTIQPSDISKFTKRMEFFYRFSSIKPTLSEPLDIDMSSRITLSGTNWFIFKSSGYSSSDAYILMSHVPYKVSTYTYDIPRNCVIELPTGAVSITPGRETLTHDAKTETAIRNAVKAMKAEVTSKVALDIAAASTPWEQAYIANSYISSFSDFVDSSSLKLDPAFTAPYTSSQFQLKQSSSPDFFLADFNGSTTRKCDRFRLQKDLIFVKQDVPTNFVDAFNSIGTSSYNMVIIKPRSNSLSAIESMVPAADTFLDHLGVPADQVYSASDYVTAAEKSAPSAKLADTVFQPTTFYLSDSSLGKSKSDNISLADNTNTYLYFEMKGNDPIDSEDLILASIRLHAFVPSAPRIIGVPQKAIAKVKLDPNFTQAETYFQALVPSLPTIPQYSGKAYNFLHHFDASYTDAYPDDILALSEIAKPYVKGRTIRASEAVSIQAFYPIQVDVLTDTSQFDVTSRYPLFESLRGAYYHSPRDKVIALSRYFDLEKHYADNPPD